MKWNIGSSSSGTTDASLPLPPDHPPIPSSSRLSAATCPVPHAASSASAPSRSGGAKCPVQHVPAPASSPPSRSGAKCPVPHDSAPSSSSSSGSGPSGLNPLNSIPLGLSATDRAPGQVLDLPTDRTASTIPRPKTDDPETDASGVWDYPSPQQFYNALVRKGWETPEESIETVVAIHNWLNEAAWEEVMRWERRKPGGEFAQLARFQGRPGELSPKARLHLLAGKIFPSYFNTTPPFDRHDWIVDRPANPPAISPDGKVTSTSTSSAPGPGTAPKYITTRYVIDYYSAPPDEEGNPVFSLDVRPALDSFESVSQRIKVGLEEYMKGQGGQGGQA
ncbi:holocytochrome c synthase [Saitozyma podzolica]|uniref:Holocytochrome c-type synthase n=1 Tax=Saitozyma podzolica TaxID=1890683 RepID=A0A427YVS8_9TREE|nr:holocytochrome c synthase [Saitozyma podzolica]